MLANINNRRSIERIYPISAFAVDAARNAKQPANEFVRGVRVLSAPDDGGEFEIAPGTRHVGEVHGETFFAAHRTLCGLHALAALYRAKGTNSEALPTSRMGQPYALVNPDPKNEYETFIRTIIAAAPRVGFRRNESPGRGDARLQGLRQ